MGFPNLFKIKKSDVQKTDVIFTEPLKLSLDVKTVEAKSTATGILTITCAVILMQSAF